jgi:acyl-CoA thioesterase-1
MSNTENYNIIKNMRCLWGGLLIVSLVSCSNSQFNDNEAQPEKTVFEGVNTAESVIAIRQERQRIVILGDSLTYGYGLDRSESYPFLLQKRLDRSGNDYEVVNAGVSGDTSAGGLRRLNWVLEGDVRVLIIELGANDGLRGLPVASLRHNLSEIIERTQEKGIAVVLTGMEAPPNYGSVYTQEFREVYQELARTYQVYFVPFLLEGVAGNPDLNLTDGIHPNASGARIVEETLWDTLKPLLMSSRND